ncbi:RTA1 like protein [Aspergillus steynii IBT 23096]|uniref:RTA1 like protein n=1 Tax=Aspergillus steynii IBT 23096 TaxID=1392250 RepID=A0A2I2GAS0_9EURO|nr:RTA1 like protein [Aspergillus steynii IBT 23096]PLB49973.1 RTA1 like protein [Aspergillus steynii IBT 23096]
MPQLETTRGGYYLWQYVPSLPAAVIFIVLFALGTAAHSWRIFKYRNRFCIAFLIGCIFEFIGYCARAACHNSTGKIMPFSIQNVFILLGPALFAASIYMTLSRIIYSIRGEPLALVHPRWLTKIFVAGDILSFIVQGSAAGLMVTGSHGQMGEYIVIAGLLIQVVMFGLFGVTAMLFQMRLRQQPTTESTASSEWKGHLRTLYIVSVLIMIRSIFRVVEYAMGQSGYLLQHEWTMFVFDSLLMFGVVVVFYIWYPGSIVFTREASGDDYEALQIQAERK